MERISMRTLNRTTLHRQMLLERAVMPASDAIDHLVGMQAQNPYDPYWALWSRLDGFATDDLSKLIESREAVRGPVLRGTLHLHSTTDYLGVRPQLQPVLSRVLGSTSFAKDTAGVDRDQLLEMGRSLLEEQPMTRAGLAPVLEARWPGVPGASLAMVATYLLPVIQIPPRGLWGRSGAARWTTIESWTGSALRPADTEEATVRRYLAAFGPATTADIRAWSGLAGLKEVVSRMRPDLEVYESESGTELLDLPGLPIMEAATPAPPRLLPEYDNVLLGHSDRTRFFPDAVVPPGWAGNLLVDGVYSGSWKSTGKKGRPRMEITVQRELTTTQRRQVRDESERILSLAYPGEQVDLELNDERKGK